MLPERPIFSDFCVIFSHFKSLLTVPFRLQSNYTPTKSWYFHSSHLQSSCFMVNVHKSLESVLQFSTIINLWRRQFILKSKESFHCLTSSICMVPCVKSAMSDLLGQKILFKTLMPYFSPYFSELAQILANQK